MKNEFKQAKIDALALEIFNEEKAEGTPVTMAEAQEMARMELGAKEVKRYEKSSTPRKKTSRERKADKEKGRFLMDCKTLIEGLGGVVTKVNNEADFSFDYGTSHFTLKIIRHRDPK